MRIRISGGRVIDPGRLDDIMDILIEDGNVVEIKPHAPSETRGETADVREIDASGFIVAPGLVDMHVHLREPGQEYKETIESGSRAAAAGGFTSVCCMPNTQPVNDTSQITDFIIKTAELAGMARVYPVAAISVGLQGKSLSEFGDLKRAGAVAFSDDGCPVMDSELMRRALEYASGFHMPVISHCEELSLGEGGVMNEGPYATRMGLAGIPNAVESIMVERDISMCELTGARLHIAHVSTAESVRAIRRAKALGLPVTAETAPHYFVLTDEAVGVYDTHAKMNPPLRSRQDMAAIREGLRDGTIDAIATDHAPHSSVEKDVEFDFAANGIIGLETSLPLCLRLVDEKILSMVQLIEKMSTNPSRILGHEKPLKVGALADITIIDPEVSWTVHAENFESLSRNTPFEGWQLKGRAMATLVGGRVVYEASKADDGKAKD